MVLDRTGIEKMKEIRHGGFSPTKKNNSSFTQLSIRFLFINLFFHLRWRRMPRLARIYSKVTSVVRGEHGGNLFLRIRIIFRPFFFYYYYITLFLSKSKKLWKLNLLYIVLEGDFVFSFFLLCVPLRVREG